VARIEVPQGLTGGKESKEAKKYLYLKFWITYLAFLESDNYDVSKSGVYSSIIIENF
jgi:hypothetical protein